MAKFIDLSVITSSAREEKKTTKVTFNSNCIVRFNDADVNEALYWGYPHTILVYTYGIQFITIRVAETREEIKDLINSL